MMTAAENTITDTWNLSKSQVCLVSGGSAWADHIAVRLFLNSIGGCGVEEDILDGYAGLKLHLP